MRFAPVVAFLLLLVPCALRAQDLPHGQKQAVDRQERNLKEAQKKLKDAQDGYAKDIAALPADALIPSAFYKKYLGAMDEVGVKCDAMTADLDKSQCPADHPRVKAITDWIAQARAEIDKFKADVAPKMAEMEKLADPKNYPNLEADFQQMEQLTKAYSLKGFMTHPDKVAELAKEFGNVITWSKAKFPEYRPIMVLTGGKNSPLYKIHEKFAVAVKSFQEEASKFFGEAEKEIPGLLKKAEEMAAKASAEKKPAFFTGGVRQQFDAVEQRLKVMRGLVPATDERLVALEAQKATCQKKVDEAAASLKELIVAEQKAPDEKYKGGDKESLREQIVAEWKKAWPDDEVLGVRFHMENFDRRQTATWDSGAKAWQFDDRGVLCVTMIVKTSDTIATLYPAYVNVDHVSNSTKFGVQTKGSAYDIREMLVANVK